MPSGAARKAKTKQAKGKAVFFQISTHWRESLRPKSVRSWALAISSRIVISLSDFKIAAVSNRNIERPRSIVEKGVIE